MKMKTRKPRLIDKVKGCIEWFVFGIECLVKGKSLLFAKEMFIKALKGNFEVVIKEEK
jgi:hypothetical protein